MPDDTRDSARLLLDVLDQLNNGETALRVTALWLERERMATELAMVKTLMQETLDNAAAT